jgi:hypothetical protein
MTARIESADDLSSLFQERLELFFGEATDTMARIYAQLDGLPEGNWSLSGTISGPESRYAQTLPSTYRFKAVPGKSPLLAEAQVLDPCFWTPAMPNLYTVNVELRRMDQPVAQIERMFGIRPLGAAGRSLWFENKRWVLRGVDAGCAPPTDFSEWRELGAAMILDSPSDAVCAEASRVGVLLVAQLTANEATQSELRRLARWPSVGMAVLIGADSPGSDLKKIAPNLMLVHPLAEPTENFPPSWSSAVLIAADRPGLFEIVKKFEKPILVQRAVGAQPSVAEARVMCDCLQRDTASLGDFSGYLVSVV